MQPSRLLRSHLSVCRQRASAVLVLMLVQLALLAFAQPAFAAAPQITGMVTVDGGGRITGHVQSSSTKAPIQGVEACAELPDVNQSGVEPHRTCATTNASGEYEIDGLTPGEGEPEGGYEVEFTSPLDYVRQFYDGKLERYSGTRIPIHSGETVPNIDAELEEGGEISGRVTSQVNGEPVAGAEACADAVAFPSFCAKTNPAGEYTITRLPSHEYTVSFSGPGGLETEYLGQDYKEKESPSAEPVSVTAPQKISGIDASLKAYGRIAGTVIDKATRRPLQGVQVCLAYGSCEETNRAGEYSFSKLLAGTYALDFYAGRLNEEAATNYLSQYEADEYIVQEELKARNPQAAHVAVTMGGRAVIDDELEEGGRITGTVQEAGTGTPASLWPCVEDLSTGHPESSRICPISNSAGAYSISGLPPGRYRVVFGNGLPAYYFTQYYDDRDLQSEAQEVLVESGETVEHIDADVIANPDPWEGAIAGTVIDASSEAAIAGIEACAIYVGTGNATGGCATTGLHGEYLLTGLKSGEYEVEFRSPPGGSLDYVRQRYDPGKAVTVVWGSITPAIDAQLDEGGAISGVAQNAETGLLAGGVSVCAYNAHGESEVCARTDASGSYRLPGLAAGSYTVGFERTAGAYFPQYFDEATSASEARSVLVEVGRTTAAVDASLFTDPHPGDGAIAGLVTDASTSAPLAGIEVCAYDAASKGMFGECAISTAGGRYLLNGLAPGEYELEFSSPQNGDISYLSVSYEEGRSVKVTKDSVAAGRDARLVAAGRLTGTVTSAATGGPVQGVGACAIDEKQEVEECAPSTADGSYAITGLPAGSYTVAFYGAGIGFANQYYDEADTLATAKPIALSAGETVGGIDARLQAGGSISGLITSGATGRPLPNVVVCALSAQEAVVECAVSEAHGEYTIAGIPSGEWRVGFDAGHGYQVQFYDGVSEFSAARAVTVAVGAAVTEINAAMQTTSVEPVPRTPPPVHPVQPPPPVQPIQPPMSPVQPVQAPQEPLYSPPPAGSTATAGSGVLGLSSVRVPPSISLSSSTITLSGRAVEVDVVCGSTSCSGSVVLTARIAVQGSSRGKHHRHAQTIVLGRGSFALASGVQGSIRADLTQAGARTLAHALGLGHPVAAALSIAVHGGSPLTRSVRIAFAR
jgi:Carboxypeptidase regulatory-like domain